MSRGYFAVGIYGCKHEVNVGTLWRSAFLYDAAYVFTVGKRYKPQASDTSRMTQHTPLLHFSDLDDLTAHIPSGSRLIGIEDTPGAISLRAFGHPLQAIYLLGAEDVGLPSEVLEACYATVVIPTVKSWSMNVATAGSIVLYDRHASLTEIGL